MWAKRVQKEIEELFKNTQELEKEGITLFPNEVNIQIFQGSIIGPIGTPYSGLKYELEGQFQFTLSYGSTNPFKK